MSAGSMAQGYGPYVPGRGAVAAALGEYFKAREDSLIYLAARTWSSTQGASTATQAYQEGSSRWPPKPRRSFEGAGCRGVLEGDEDAGGQVTTGGAIDPAGIPHFTGTGRSGEKRHRSAHTAAKNLAEHGHGGALHLLRACLPSTRPRGGEAVRLDAYDP